MNFKRERFLYVPEEHKEYKFVLNLFMEYDNLSWKMVVYYRNRYLSDEKIIQKKSLNNDWIVTSKKIPKNMEMIFSQLKDDIFEEINLNFLKTFRAYKSKFS